jgi:hypothetical protein
MLTAEQIRHTKTDVELHVKDNISFQTVESLAGAYERVKALLEQCKKDSLGLRPGAPYISIEELDRALEG